MSSLTLKTSPLLVLRPGIGCYTAGHGSGRPLTLNQVRITDYFMNGASKEDAIKNGISASDIQDLIESGVLVESQGRSTGGKDIWETYNWQRAAFLMFNKNGTTGGTENEAITGSGVKAKGVASPAVCKGTKPSSGPGDIMPTAVSNPSLFVDKMLNRRTQRFFSDQSITREQFQNIVKDVCKQLAVTPWISAYIVVQAVDGLEKGVYRIASNTSLTLSKDEYKRKDLLECAHGQWWLNGGGFCLFFVVSFADMLKHASKPYSYMEMLIKIGNAGQALVQSVYMNGLGAWMTPAISESLAARLLGLNYEQEAMYFFKVGVPQNEKAGERRSPI